MRRIFVYEWLSGGPPGTPCPADQELMGAGVAMRNAIVGDLLRLGDVQVTCAGGEPGRRTADRARAAWRLAAAAAPTIAELDFVARLAALHDRCWIVAPETGGALARLHAAVGDERWIGCDAASIRCAASKRATLAAAGRGTACRRP